LTLVELTIVRSVGSSPQPGRANLALVEDLAPRFADLLESTATKIRSLTVDRAEKAVKIIALALSAVVFGLTAVVFLVMTIHAMLRIAAGPWGAYAIEAGLFLIVGAFLWGKRK
jgi:hypothetical protein